MKYLVIGNYGVGNIGDECIGKGIEHLLTQKDHQAQVSFMGKGTLLPVGVRSFLRSLVRPSLWMQPLRLIRNSDHVIVGGGGLFTDEERPLTGFFWAVHGLIASYMGKPVTLLGVSIGSMGPMSRLVTKKLLKRAKQAYCRDEFSVRYSHSHGAKNAELCPDMATLLAWNTHSDGAGHINHKKHILFILRDYKEFDENKITIFIHFANHLYEKYGLKSVFTAFSVSSYLDRALLNKIIDHNTTKNTISILELDNNFEAITKVFKESKFVVSMRYHGGLLALTHGIPFISINYMQKSSNFWCMFPEVHTLSFQKLDYTILKQTVEKSIDSDSYNVSMKEANNRLHKQISEFVLSFSM